LQGCVPITLRRRCASPKSDVAPGLAAAAQGQVAGWMGGGVIGWLQSTRAVGLTAPAGNPRVILCPVSCPSLSPRPC
jgi:hypothetical protein